MGSVTIRQVLEPDDPALEGLSQLMQTTFADPDTVLELDRIQAFLAESTSSDRQFCVIVAEDGGLVLGGSVFSYVPSSNCGFSEYLLVRKDHHRQGLGRQLFEARRAVLHQLARNNQNVACRGLFIEADNPERTPLELQARERETAIDAHVRLQVFAHLGFVRVEIDYVQPALGTGKDSVSYLDLLFAAWDDPTRSSVPGGWVTLTLCAIWKTWSPATVARECAALRERVGESPVALVPIA